MDKFDEVFLSIKKHCEVQALIAEIDCFDTACRETNIPLSKLPLYLNHLKEKGLINYSMKDKYIHLTSLGKKYDKLN